MKPFQKSKSGDMRTLRAAGFSLATADRLAQPRRGGGAVFVAAGAALVLLMGGIATLGLSVGSDTSQTAASSTSIRLENAVNAALVQASVAQANAPAQPTPDVAPNIAALPAALATADLDVAAQTSQAVLQIEPAPTPFEQQPAAPQTAALEVPTLQAAGPAIDCAASLDAYLGGQFIQFGVASSDIPEQAIDLLSGIKTRLAGCADAALQIAGHSDRSGDDTLNIQLSWERADNTRDALISMGADAAHLEALGFGARAPLAQGSDTDDAANRRVEFRVTRLRTSTQ